jgi:hypothetical protein
MGSGGINGTEYESARQSITVALKDAFEKTDRVYDAVEAMITSGPIRINVARLGDADPTVVPLSIALLTKGLKSFRAVKVTAQEGCGQDASILLRGLFENCLAVLWLLDKDSTRRARMYAAHSDQRAMVAIEERLKIDSLRVKAAEEHVIVQRRLESWLQLLTPEDLSTCRRHWSGLRGVEQVASTLDGWTVAYVTLYRTTSNYAHGADAESHLRMSDSGVPIALLLPGLQELSRVLNLNCTL